jgi:hypothetical protein
MCRERLKEKGKFPSSGSYHRCHLLLVRTSEIMVRRLGKVRPMPFTVYGENPGGGRRSKFTRDTATGAVFKAADLMRDGWTGVHIRDEQNQIYWPDRFHLVSKSNTEKPPW